MTPTSYTRPSRGFAAFRELDGLSQHTLVLEEGASLDKIGLLKLNGHCPTQPQATTFRLSYMVEQTEWKLLGIHVAMKKMPAAAVSDPSTPMNQSGPPKADHLNVLAAENGSQVVFCSKSVHIRRHGGRKISSTVNWAAGTAMPTNTANPLKLYLPCPQQKPSRPSVLTPIPWNRLTGGPRTLPLRCPPRTTGVCARWRIHLAQPHGAGQKDPAC